MDFLQAKTYITSIDDHPWIMEVVEAFKNDEPIPEFDENKFIYHMVQDDGLSSDDWFIIKAMFKTADIDGFINYCNVSKPLNIFDKFEKLFNFSIEDYFARIFMTVYTNPLKLINLNIKSIENVDCYIGIFKLLVVENMISNNLTFINLTFINFIRFDEFIDQYHKIDDPDGSFYGKSFHIQNFI